MRFRDESRGRDLYCNDVSGVCSGGCSAAVTRGDWSEWDVGGGGAARRGTRAREGCFSGTAAGEGLSADHERLGGEGREFERAKAEPQCPRPALALPATGNPLGRPARVLLRSSLRRRKPFFQRGRGSLLGWNGGDDKELQRQAAAAGVVEEERAMVVLAEGCSGRVSGPWSGL